MVRRGRKVTTAIMHPSQDTQRPEQQRLYDRKLFHLTGLSGLEAFFNCVYRIRKMFESLANTQSQIILVFANIRIHYKSFFKIP